MDYSGALLRTFLRLLEILEEANFQFCVIGGMAVSIATPEDLLLMKQQAGRPIDREDWKAIREVHADTLDEAYIASWQEKLGLDHE